METYLRVLFVLALPFVVFFSAANVIKHLTGRGQFESQATEAVPLHFRVGGYDSSAASAYWKSLEKDGRQAERRFLEADLVFPFLYGGALLASLVLTWFWLGRPFNPTWLVLTVAITVVADWIENLVQWQQLGTYINSQTVRNDWIQVATLATTTKLVFLCGSCVLLFGLAVWLLARSSGLEK